MSRDPKNRPIETSPPTPFIESEAREDDQALRGRMKDDGYLFFRALAPADLVLSIRRQILELCQDADWLDPSRHLMDAVARPNIAPQSEGTPDYLALYRKVLRLPDFHDLPTQPALMNIASILLQSEAWVHPRRMGRVTFPNNIVATTPPHQDFFYIRGSVETYSCWIPLGECPLELSGLAVAPGSHHNGFREHTEHIPGAVGGRGVPESDYALWHTSNFGWATRCFSICTRFTKPCPTFRRIVCVSRPTIAIRNPKTTSIPPRSSRITASIEAAQD